MIDATTTSAPETAPDVATADDVRAAIEQLKGNEQPDRADDQAAATSHPDDVPSDRQRDERGRFSTKAEDGADKQPEPADKNTDTDPTQDKPEEPSTAPEPPKSWSAAEKGLWNSLDPAIKSAVSRREQEMDRGGKQWSEDRQRYDQVLAPVAEAARRAGVPPQEGLNRLLAWNRRLEVEPEAAIRDLAREVGVDLTKLNTQQPQASRVDPATAQLNQRISGLESELAARSRAETEATINAFASAPGHEHFEDVKQVMGRLMSSGQATSLQDAYDQAVWANSGTRAKLLAAQTATTSAAQKQRDTVDRAKRGALSTTGSPGASAAAVPKRDYDTVEEAVRAAAREHGLIS